MLSRYRYSDTPKISTPFKGKNNKKIDEYSCNGNFKIVDCAEDPLALKVVIKSGN